MTRQHHDGHHAGVRPYRAGTPALLGVLPALLAAGCLAGCGGGSSSGGPLPSPGGSSSGFIESGSPPAGESPTAPPGHHHRSSSPPAAQPTPTASVSAAPRCPVTGAEVQRAFGQRFAGPKAPLSTYEACVFGKTKPGDHHVVQVTVFTKATLQTLGTTARAYLHGNRQPTATTVSGLGAEAFVQGADVWVRTGSDDVLDVGADFAAGRSALEALARDALRRL